MIDTYCTDFSRSTQQCYPVLSITEIAFVVSCLFPCRQTPSETGSTVKILKFGTPQIIPIIVLKIEKFDVKLH